LVFSAVNCKENRINSPGNSNKLLPSAPATTALVNQRCNFFFPNISSSFMPYCEPFSMCSYNNNSATEAGEGKTRE
jgi:hypothetical protein